MRWRRINTAPHDSSAKLVGFFPCDEYHSMYWSASDKAWQSLAWPEQPTHWRPAPISPKVTHVTEERKCKHGHVAPKYAVGRNCVECVRLRAKKQYAAIKADPEKREKHRRRIAEYRMECRA